GPRAWLDRDAVLVVRPGHFPVLAVAALALEQAPGQSVSLDVTRLELPSAGRLIEAPLLVAAPPLAGQPLLLSAAGLSRSRRQWVVVTYTGGLPVGGVPYDVWQACAWVASELLAQRRNPTGAAGLRLGKYEQQQRPRTDPSGDSLLLLQAKAALEPYRERV
nr:hypothetical protein [Ktedonobacterales bacterium]